ncbi:unnamed protein product [Enterobius vermicularis]|uniref:Uncharacterized protein n=1 Tax=Enterobius vermicularis TaxID=51028 RepID=A0A0N4V4Y8_ENTVE|nr:unnamed protein product [Enterobius vermicularis]
MTNCTLKLVALDDGMRQKCSANNEKTCAFESVLRVHERGRSACVGGELLATVLVYFQLANLSLYPPT